MRIKKTFNDELYPMSEFLMERQYIPCFCRVNSKCFEISFSDFRIKDIVLFVEDFNLEVLEEYVPVGVGGEWEIYNNSLITLREKKDNSQELKIIDLAFFDLYLGWCWVIRNGNFINVPQIDIDDIGSI